METMNGYLFIADNHIFNYGLKSRDIAVYCTLCRHRNKEASAAFPSQKTIAKECGIGKVDTVDKALRKLCKMGLISGRQRSYTDEQLDELLSRQAGAAKVKRIG